MALISFSCFEAAAQTAGLGLDPGRMEITIKPGQEKTIEIKIPAGVETGSRLRVTGEGEAGVGGGPTGDLYIVIHVADHEY